MRRLSTYVDCRQEALLGCKRKQTVSGSTATVGYDVSHLLISIEWRDLMITHSIRWYCFMYKHKQERVTSWRVFILPFHDRSRIPRGIVVTEKSIKPPKNLYIPKMCKYEKYVSPVVHSTVYTLPLIFCNSISFLADVYGQKQAWFCAPKNRPLGNLPGFKN